MISRKTKILVAVASLGYFVDAFDLILFGVVRVPSLKSLGLSDAEILNQGQMLFNYQLLGMMVGGILWGILGDKKGRKSVLFASIIIYSLANFLNGMVTDLSVYALLRFIAGIGLAGELGVGVTLVSESLPIEKRGYGTSIIATFGALGALSAPLLYKIAGTLNLQTEAWRIAYYVGGIMGFLLLFLRIGVMESDLFRKIENNSNKGNFFQIFTNKNLFKKYLLCILLGLPVWYLISILTLVAPEMAVALNVKGKITGGDAIFYMYSGLAIGDIACGLLSQLLKSRKKAIYIYLTAAVAMAWLYLKTNGLDTQTFYFLCFTLGLVAGYWALFVTVASEQFGTNLRSTATTTIPNFVRGAVVLINMAFLSLSKNYGIVNSAIIIGLVCFILAFISNYNLKESFYNDLDYLEK
jgi:MFS transporter, putative metabolite:H+ symporter